MILVGEILSVAARLALTTRCAFGNKDGMRSIWSCIYEYDLDLRTLIRTRGAARATTYFSDE